MNKDIIRELMKYYKPEGIGGNCTCDICETNRPVYNALESLLTEAVRRENESLKFDNDCYRQDQITLNEINGELKAIKQIIIEDVPHRYQKRLKVLLGRRLDE